MYVLQYNEDISPTPVFSLFLLRLNCCFIDMTVFVYFPHPSLQTNVKKRHFLKSEASDLAVRIDPFN